MEFAKHLCAQIDAHPSAGPRDIVKLCYQAAFGAEHLLSDRAAAWDYLKMEYDAVQKRDIPLFESICDDVCRINLEAWKYRNLPPEWLFEMFAGKAKKPDGSAERFAQYLDTAGEIILQGKAGFSADAWQEYLAEYRQSGMPAVHHSARYREHEKPAYRIVGGRYIRILPILEKAREYLHADKVCVIALDGRAASGKSTMARQLERVLGASVIHMDDFFLPPALRTQERFDEPGGNIHYERFIDEVLPLVSRAERFSYRLFDCGLMDFNGERVVENTKFRVVEGSYSCHPVFGEYADITVFSDIEPCLQAERILRRNGEEMLQMFRDRWIPLEEKYFKAHDIAAKAGLRL